MRTPFRSPTGKVFKCPHGGCSVSENKCTSLAKHIRAHHPSIRLSARDQDELSLRHCHFCSSVWGRVGVGKHQNACHKRSSSTKSASSSRRRPRATQPHPSPATTLPPSSPPHNAPQHPLPHQPQSTVPRSLFLPPRQSSPSSCECVHGQLQRQH